MRLFFSPGSDPMVLDSLEGMNALHRRLVDFLSGPALELAVAAETSGSPEPYDTFLRGIRIRKDQGPIQVRLADDGYLSLAGSVQNLSVYVGSFRFRPDEEGAHHHPDIVVRNGQPMLEFIAPESLSLIVEVDSQYVAGEGES